MQFDSSIKFVAEASPQSGLEPDRKFEPFRPNDRRYPASMGLSILGESSTIERNTHISHWLLLSYNSKGEEVGRRPINSIEAPLDQTVIDNLSYCTVDGTEYIFLTESQRPAIAARRLLAPQSFADAMPAMQRSLESGRIWGLPGTYMRPYHSQTSLKSGVDFVTVSKMGLTPLGPSEYIGGSHYPSIGGSTELAIPNAQLVGVPKEFDRVRYGEHFQASQRVRAFTHQQLLDWYEAGELPDFRAVLASLQRAQACNIKLSTGLVIETSNPLKNTDSPAYPIRSIEQVKDLADRQPENPDAVCRVVLLRLEHSPPAPFLRSYDVQFRNFNREGVALEPAAKIAQVIVRQGSDSADSLCWFERDGKLFIVAKRGIRIATELMNQQQHPINADSNIFHIEGAAVALNGERSQEEIAARLAQKIAEEMNLVTVGPPHYVGSTFPSAGYNPELVHGFIYEVDPTRLLNPEAKHAETVDHFCVELNDYLELYNQGTVRDGRSVLLAHLLKLAKQYPDSSRPNLFLTEENEDFQAVISKHSPLQRYLLSDAGSDAATVDRKLCAHSITYLRLKEYGECDLGFIFSDFEQFDAPGFYDQLIEILPRFSTTNPGLVPFRIAHDLCHYSKRPLIPFEVTPNGELKRDIEGRPCMRPFNEYLADGRLDECDAVWYSDSLLPKLFGLKEARKIFGASTLGEAFEEMGLSQRQAREAVRSIEGQGVIPDSIMKHPEFGRFMDLIVNQPLYRYVMDEHQLKIRYESWSKNPELCEVAAKLFTRRALNDQEGWDLEDEELRSTDYPHSKRSGDAHARSRGFNPLRSEIAQARNQQFRLQAFKLAHLRHLIRENSGKGWEEHYAELGKSCERLIESYHKLGEIQSKVRNINRSDENRLGLRALREAQHGIFAQAVRLYERTLQNRELISQEQCDHNTHKLIPFVAPYPKDPARCSEDIIARVKELAVQNLGRVGQVLPYNLTIKGLSDT